MSIRFGLALPHYAYSLPHRSGGTLGSAPSWTGLLEVARWAEDVGFASLWMSDHVYLDLSKYGGTRDRYSSFEYTATLGALSQATNKVDLGVLVACSVLRPPAVLARSAETIASGSGRRFWLGLGAGWYPPDFEAAGVPFGSASQRLARLKTTTELVSRFIRSQYPVTTIVGGKGGPKLLEIAALYADGWNVSWAISPRSLSAKVALLRELRDRAGRSRTHDHGLEVPYVSVGLTCLVAKNEKLLRTRFFEMMEEFKLRSPESPETLYEEAKTSGLICTTAQLTDRIDLYHRAGASEIVCGFGPVPFSFWKLGVAEEFIEAAGLGRS
ncbi:MAG: hypothetical protein C4319_01370 [Acidimicrobiia bacterium]